VPKPLGLEEPPETTCSHDRYDRTRSLDQEPVGRWTTKMVNGRPSADDFALSRSISRRVKDGQRYAWAQVNRAASLAPVSANHSKNTWISGGL
jgi:hypothetical protein